MKRTEPQRFAKLFPHVAVEDLDDIMEWLNDNEYLTFNGQVFKNEFWQFFIKN